MTLRVEVPLSTVSLFTERSEIGCPRAPLAGVCNALGYSTPSAFLSEVTAWWAGNKLSPQGSVTAAELVALIHMLQFKTSSAGKLARELHLGGATRTTTIASEMLNTTVDDKLAEPSKATKELPWAMCDPADVGMDKEILEKCRRYLNYRVGRKHFAGIVGGVVKNGKLVYFDEVGHADIEKKTPIKQDTIMRLFSMTKCIVVVAFFAYVEEKPDIKLDDPVWKYIPSFKNIKLAPKRGSTKPRNLETITEKGPDGKTTRLPSGPTLRHLLTHTAGLGYGPTFGDSLPPKNTDHYKIYYELLERTNQGKITSLAEWIDELAKIPLKVRPGSYWEYSFATDILGRVVEVISGLSLAQAVEEKVCGPLGMVDSGFSVPAEKAHRMSAWYEKKNPVDDKGVEIEKPQPGATYNLKIIDKSGVDSGWVGMNCARILSGGGTVDIPMSIKGGMVSTFKDYLRFLMMIRNFGELDGVRVLRKETVQMMICNQIPASTGRRAAWVFDKKGQGFNFLGQVQVQHYEKDTFLEKGELKKGNTTYASLAPGTVSGEFGWGGLGGPAWTIDPRADLIVLSMTQTALELDHEENLRFSARRAIHAGIFGPTAGAMKVTDYPPEGHEAIKGSQLPAPRTSVNPTQSGISEESNDFLEMEQDAKARGKSLKELANSRGNVGHEIIEEEDVDTEIMKTEESTPIAGPVDEFRFGDVSNSPTSTNRKRTAQGLIDDGSAKIDQPKEPKKKAKTIQPANSEKDETPTKTVPATTIASPGSEPREGLLFTRVSIRGDDSKNFQKARVTGVDGENVEVIMEGNWRARSVGLSDVTPIDESRIGVPRVAEKGPTDFGFLMQKGDDKDTGTRSVTTPTKK